MDNMSIMVNPFVIEKISDMDMIPDYTAFIAEHTDTITEEIGDGEITETNTTSRICYIKIDSKRYQGVGKITHSMFHCSRQIFVPRTKEAVFDKIKGYTIKLAKISFEVEDYNHG